MDKLPSILIASLLSVWLASCGGGGSTSGSTPPPPPLPTAQSVAIATGNNQTAAPGTQVPVPPQVLVMGTNNAPLAGVTVTFSVTGGGSVSSKTAVTDSQGHASTNWTVGSTVGINTLTASVPQLAPAAFTATAARSSKDVTVKVASPSSTVPVGDATTVFASITSTYQLVSVTATYGDRSVALAYGPNGDVRPQYGWTGVLSLTGLPRGPGTVVVTAIDASGNATDIVIQVTLDRPPVVAFDSPADGLVANPSATVAASCTDDGPAACSTFKIVLNDFGTNNGVVLASAASTISRTFDLSKFAGKEIQLVAQATDSAGQTTQVARMVYVEANAHLTSWAVVAGKVWDVLGTRVLFTDATVSVPTLKMFDRSTGQTTSIDADQSWSDGDQNQARLTNLGVVYSRDADSTPLEPFLYEWKAGTVNTLGRMNYPGFRSNAGWVAYQLAPDAGGTATLWERDVGTGVSTAIAPAKIWDVAPNGDVAYIALDGNVYRSRNGVVTALTSDTSATLTNTDPVTDGVNVVYEKYTNSLNDMLYLSDGTTETALTPTASTQPLGRDYNYAAADSFVAYSVEDQTQALQVWRRGPSGSEQITFFSSTSTIDAMGSQGAMMVKSDQRYLALPGKALEPVSSTQGQAIYRDASFYVLIDRTVLLVTP